MTPSHTNDISTICLNGDGEEETESAYQHPHTHTQRHTHTPTHSLTCINGVCLTFVTLTPQWKQCLRTCVCVCVRVCVCASVLMCVLNYVCVHVRCVRCVRAWPCVCMLWTRSYHFRAPIPFGTTLFCVLCFCAALVMSLFLGAGDGMTCIRLRGHFRRWQEFILIWPKISLLGCHAYWVNKTPNMPTSGRVSAHVVYRGLKWQGQGGDAAKPKAAPVRWLEKQLNVENESGREARGYIFIHSVMSRSKQPI